MNKDLILSKTKELITQPSCFGELKALAEDWMNSVGKDNEKEKFDKYIEYLKGSVSPIEACIEFLKSDFGKQIYGDTRDAVLKDAEDKKAKGEKICTCGACRIGDEILRNI